MERPILDEGDTELASDNGMWQYQYVYITIYGGFMVQYHLIIMMFNAVENLVEDLLEPVELVEAGEIVTANCNIHPHENLVVTPKVNFHTADLVTAIPAVKETRDRKFSLSFVEKAMKFKKAISFARIGNGSRKKYVILIL